MYKTLFSLLAALLLAFVSSAQIDFRIGPEVGCGIWGVPKSDAFTDSYQSYETYQGAGFSSILGVSGRWQFGKHWQLQHGLDYQSTSIHSHGHYSYNYAYYNASGTKFDNHLRLRQIVMPITWGLALGKGRVRPSFNVGARFGYIFSGIEEVNSEYTVWSGNQPKPDPIHEKVDILKGYFKDRFIAQGLMSFQLEIADQFSLGLHLAIGSSSYASRGSYFYPPAAMPFATFSYRPLRRLLKEAPIRDENKAAPTRFQTGPEIGYSFPVFPQSPTTTQTDYSTTTETQSPKFTPLFGWSGRFSFGKHWLMDAAIQYQFTGVRYRIEKAYGVPNNYYVTQAGTIGVHKVGIPFAFGYGWNIGKFSPYATLGGRINFLAHRHQEYDLNTYTQDPPANSFTTHSNYNGFSTSFPKRFLLQVMANAGTTIGQHLQISLTYAIGPGRNYAESIKQSRYRNIDCYATLAWRLW